MLESSTKLINTLEEELKEKAKHFNNMKYDMEIKKKHEDNLLVLDNNKCINEKSINKKNSCINKLDDPHESAKQSRIRQNVQFHIFILRTILNQCLDILGILRIF